MTNETVVFGDIVGSESSRISSIAELLRILNLTPEKCPEPPSYTNSWGDAFVAVFQSSTAAVRYALEIRDRLRFYDWRAIGLFTPPKLRIGVESGDLEWSLDQFRGATAPVGMALVTAARVEASASPGDVRVTQTVRLLLRKSTAEFYFESLGMVSLPKNSESIELFRVYRAAEEPDIEFPGPLQDDQHFLRLRAMRRFALTWLLIDQLPRGSWGRSTETWMRNVWRNEPHLASNPLIGDEGGFETTVLNFGMLAEIVGAQRAIEYAADAMRYLSDRRTSQGFGGLSLSRHGYEIEPQTRHTAMAAWLFGCRLKEYSLNDSNFRDLFRSAVEVLFSEPSHGAALHDRNPGMLYVATWRVAKELESPEWSNHFSRVEASRMRRSWNIMAASLERLLLRLEYDTRSSDGSMHPVMVGDRIVPYGGFRKMETYTLLTTASLVHAEMPEGVRLRLARGVESVVDDYLARFGRSKDRYTKDALIPARRGPLPYLPSSSTPLDQPEPDLGTSSLILGVLRGGARNVLWPAGLSSRLCRARYLLEEDLIEQFDRYAIDPALFDLTSAGSLAAVLVGDDPKIVEEIWNDCSEIRSAVRLTELTGDTVDSVLSEKRIGELIESSVARAPAPGMQLSAYSLTRLLVDRAKPGRYLEERLGARGVREVSARTTAVYADEAFVELYDDRWGQKPDLYIASPFNTSLNPRSQILDVGCGPGQYAEYFSKCGHHVDILDASQPFLNVAHRRLMQTGSQTSQVFRCDVLDAGQRSSVHAAPYDAIWCCGLFAHCPRETHDDLLRWLHSLLAEGGHLFVNVLIGNPRIFARDGRYFSYLGRPAEFVATLEAVGFTPNLMVERVISRNTHAETNVNSTWINYFARKAQTNHAKPAEKTAIPLTTRAYDRSVAAFVRAHSGVTKERQDFISGELDLLARFVGSDNFKILDAGCGPGDFSLAMARRGWNVIGVDVSTEMVGHARTRLAEVPGAPLLFRRADITHLPEAWNDAFDAVLCVTALQHIPLDGGQLRLALAEFRRVLRLGGVLRVDVRIGLESGFEVDGRFVQKFPDAATFQELLKQAGFEILELRPDKLPLGQNSFKRPISLEYARVWARK